MYDDLLDQFVHYFGRQLIYIGVLAHELDETGNICDFLLGFLNEGLEFDNSLFQLLLLVVIIGRHLLEPFIRNLAGNIVLIEPREQFV